jgi:probable rRNA maturation factor
MGEDGDQPRILISNRQGLPLDEGGLADLARSCLGAEGAARSELSLSFVEEPEMADLHVRYLSEEGPTDVLSFPLDDEDEEGIRILGDVVICPAYAGRNTRDLEAELRLLVVHGILHLLGYAHDDAEDRAVMWSRQRRYSGVGA